MASAEPPHQPSPSDNNDLGPIALAVCCPLFALGLVLFTIRIVPRVRPTWRLRRGDYVITAALALETITLAFFIVAITHGFGRRSYFVSPAGTWEILRWLFGVQVAGLLAGTLARTSIPLVLLDLMPDSAAWRTILWISIILQVAIYLPCFINTFLQCQPTRSMWEEVPGSRCGPAIVGWILGYTYCGVSLLCEILYAVMPVFVVTKLNRPAIERVLIGGLMGVCLAASVASIMKIRLMKLDDYTAHDLLRSMFRVSLWCRIEELLLIIASSAPFSKGAIEGVIRRLNLSSFENTAISLNSYHSKVDNTSQQGIQHGQSTTNTECCLESPAPAFCHPTAHDGYRHG